MRALALLVVVAACRQDGGDDYLIVPGGDDTVIGIMPDGPLEPDAGDGGGTFEGRVCLLVDPRAQGECADTGAGGLAVTIGTQAAVTGDAGQFAMVPPEGSNLVWHVAGLDIVPSVAPLSSSRTIPAISVALYEQMLLENSVILPADQGSIFVRVLSGGSALVGATVRASPAPGYFTHYDGVDSLVWDQDATGAFGVAWITGAAAGATALTVTPPQGTPVVTSVPVEQLAITFVTVAVP